MEPPKSLSFALGRKSSTAPSARPVARALQFDNDPPEEGQKSQSSSLDQEALDALLGKKPAKALLIIESSANERRDLAADAQSFRSDVSSKPEIPSASEYSNTDIGDFGAALVRGMGWKDGEGLGKNKNGIMKIQERKIRPVGFGVGSKHAPDAVELGAWGKAAKKSSRIDRSFNPLNLKDPKTGKVVSEEDFQKASSNDKLLPPARTPDGPALTHRDRDRDDSRRHKSIKEPHNGKSDDYRDRGASDSGRDLHRRHRERSRSPDRHRHRQRDGRDDSDRKRSRREHDSERDRYRQSSSRGDKDERDQYRKEKRADRAERNEDDHYESRRERGRRERNKNSDDKGYDSHKANRYDDRQKEKHR